MKKLLTTIAIVFVALFVGATLVTSCSGKKADQQEQKDGDAKADSTATAYACPMHPEVTGKEGDKCSKCEMKLEAVNKDKEK